MKSCGFYNNLKGFFYSKPPLIVFTFCLAMVALLSVSVSLYVKHADLKAGDVTKDWNVFLDGFSLFEFCIQTGNDGPTYTTNSATPPPLPLPSSSSSLSSTPLPDKTLRNYTVPMVIIIQPTQEFVNVPHNLTVLSGYVEPILLGFKNADVDDGLIEVSLEIPFNWNSTRCEGIFHDTCDKVKVYACITIRAPENFLPHSKVFPQSCEPSINSSDYTLEYRAQMASYKKTSNHKCTAQPIMWLRHDLDPALTVYLSLADKSIINLHLLNTSFFLFIMVLMIFVFALFRGRVHKLTFDSCNSREHHPPVEDNSKIVPLLAEAEV